MISTNQFKNGMHIEVDGTVYRIVEFQHVKPGKGGAFVRTKLKALESGSVVDRTFRAGEKFARIHTEVKNVQFLYDDGSEAHFMDEETYEQFGLPHTEVADELAYLPPSSTVQMLQVDGKPSGIQLPASVELTVAQTEPAVRGDTVTVVLNGKTVIPGAKIPDLPPRGRIALQHHGGKQGGKWNSPPALIQFKNIFIKELKQ